MTNGLAPAAASDFASRGSRPSLAHERGALTGITRSGVAKARQRPAQRYLLLIHLRST